MQNERQCIKSRGTDEANKTQLKNNEGFFQICFVSYLTLLFQIKLLLHCGQYSMNFTIGTNCGDREIYTNNLDGQHLDKETFV